MKVLWLYLLLIDRSASLKILENNGVFISAKKYETDTSVSFFISYKPLVHKRLR